MDLSNSKILVVDDEPELREILAFDFENLGYVVREAENAFSALKQLDQNPDIKVIISDIRMPDGDGVTLLKNIQSRKVKEAISLIFVTGFSDLKIEEALNLGADGYITKPFDRRVLSGLVKRLLVPESERWSDKANISARGDKLNLNLSLPSFVSATRDNLLGLGRGGMFVSTEISPLSADSICDFRIEFGKGVPRKIEGQGIVRWTRASSLGIEFLYLSDESREFILNDEARQKQVAFIPLVTKEGLWKKTS